MQFLHFSNALFGNSKRRAGAQQPEERGIMPSYIRTEQLQPRGGFPVALDSAETYLSPLTLRNICHHHRHCCCCNSGVAIIDGESDKGAGDTREWKCLCRTCDGLVGIWYVHCRSLLLNMHCRAQTMLLTPHLLIYSTYMHVLSLYSLMMITCWDACVLQLLS